MQEKTSDKTSIREIPVIYLKGLCMGSADVVPGVSGGTMALILGIYQRLIDAIKSVNYKAIRSLLKFDLKNGFAEIHWLFMAVLLTGMITAVFFFTKVVPLPVLMHTHPELIYGLFFGLIVGSVVLLILAFPTFNLGYFLLLTAGTIVGYRVVTLVPTDTPEHPLFVFLSGALAITAMILPGISGSFILLILRKYDYILGSFGKLGTSETMDALVVLVPFGLGILIGIVLFSRLLSWLLQRSYWGTLCVLIGFMVGSLYVIWPYQVREYVELVRIEEAPVSSPEVQRLMSNPMPRRIPEYRELGEIVNPQAPLSEQSIQIRTVRFKLVSGHPFLPDFSNPDQDTRLSDGSRALNQGLYMMFTGMLLVAMAGWYARKKNGSILA